MSKLALKADLCYNKLMKLFGPSSAGNTLEPECNLFERSHYGYSILFLSTLQALPYFPLGSRREPSMASKYKDLSRSAPINKNCNRIQYTCDYCGEVAWDKPSSFNKKKRHFCTKKCYTSFRKDLLPREEHPRWEGIGDKQEYHRRYVKSHPEKIAHLKARRYAREKGAEGSHTFEEWELLKLKFNNRCAICKKDKPLTKDHIIPISRSGTDFISNIQPLCRNCNSRKWIKETYIYEHPELEGK